jgi:hypothetical protein
LRWFKHLTRSHDDAKLCSIMEEFGAEGYGVWWIILERIGAEMEGPDPSTFLEIPIRNWAKSCHISVKKLQKFVRFCSDFEIFQSEQSGYMLKINIPNLLKYKDEYLEKSGRKRSPTPKNIPLDIDTEIEEERNRPVIQKSIKEIPPKPKEEDEADYPEDFDSFWKVYPRRLNKVGAYRCWQARIKSGEVANILIKSAENYAIAKTGTEKSYLMLPTTFLGRDKRFRDYLDGGHGNGEQSKKGDTPQDRSWQFRDYTADTPEANALRAMFRGDDKFREAGKEKNDLSAVRKAGNPGSPDPSGKDHGKG